MLPIEFYKLRTHLKNLDSESKHMRFGYAATDEIIDVLCDGFERNQQSHKFFVVENDRFEFVAVGHIATEHNMELAFSVLKEYQGHGLGNSLMKRCIQYCRIIGKLKGCMVCLARNSVIRHLCRKNGIKLTNELGEALAEIELDHPDLKTYIDEATDSNLEVIEYVRKRFSPYRFTYAI
jgi:GNAT superfamily N-acetyltransferase